MVSPAEPSTENLDAMLVARNGLQPLADTRHSPARSKAVNASSQESGTVLLVANYASDVGYAWWLMENFWHVIATAVSQNGGSCLLAYPTVRSIPELIRDSPLEIIEFRFSWRSWRHIREGLRLIRRHRVRSIYLTDWPHFHWAYLVWRLVGVRRIVLHVHTSAGDHQPAEGLRKLLKEAVHALRLLSATSYVAVSSYVSQRLHVACGVPPRRCTVVTNGIRLFGREAINRRDVRDRIGIPQDAVLVALVSRATFAKNLDFAVHCVARVLEDPRLRDTLYVVHCGDGPDLETFVRLAREAGISANFRFLGLRQDVRDILCAADIGFHPSRGEAMSLAILEFMCAGLAVVTSDLPSVCSAIDAGLTGLTYRHDDLDHAAAALRRLIDDPALRQSLGTAAVASCRDRYSLETMNDAFVKTVIPALL